MADGMTRIRKWTVLSAFASLVTGACSGFGPSVGEDEDVGSNTNWLVSCSKDAECGGELHCICGACSRFCSGPEDCESGSTCPAGRGAFQMACPDQVVEGVESSCRAECGTDGDCGRGDICVDQVCAQPGVEACTEVSELVWDSEPGMLRGRVGSLFGTTFYIPEQPPLLSREEAYQPVELSVIAMNSAGEPVSGCEVALVSDETSGFAYAVNPITDDEGRVSFLWVAGTASEQSMSARVLTENGDWLSVSASGEARRHDEEPLSTDAEPLTTTRMTSLGLSYSSASAAESVRVRFLPLTFPPSAIYGALTTSGLELWFINGGMDSATVSEPSEFARSVFFRAEGSDTFPGSVVFSPSADDCRADGMDMVCNEFDAWTLGEESTWRVNTRHLAVGEVVPDYDFGEPPPCEGEEGCTDYSIFLIRPEEEPELRAIMRSPLIDDLSRKGAFIDGAFNDELGLAPSCLLTEQSSYFVAHEVLNGGEWEPSTGGELEASPFGFRGEACANYAAYSRDGGYYLSTGGPSPVSTPHLPDGTLPLE